jgi:hypothetical protein
MIVMLQNNCINSERSKFARHTQIISRNFLGVDLRKIYARMN